MNLWQISVLGGGDKEGRRIKTGRETLAISIGLFMEPFTYFVATEDLPNDFFYILDS